MRTRIGAVLTFAGLALFLESGRLPAAPVQLGLSATIQGGHDDRILTGVTAADTVSASSAPFGTTQLDLHLRRDGAFDRFDLNLDAAASGYGQGTGARDGDLRATARYRRKFQPSWLGEASVAGVRFRRRNASLLDLDMIEPGLLLAWTPKPSWVISGAADYSKPHYPGREIYDIFGNAFVPPRSETDQGLDLSLSLLRDFSPQRSLELEAGWRSNWANDPLVEYSGPLVELQADLGSPELLRLSSFVAYNNRGYTTSRTDNSGTPEALATPLRRDQSLQLGLGAQRRLLPRALAFVSGAWLRQFSNVPAARYHQTRLLAGLRFDLVPEPAAARDTGGLTARPSAPGNGLAPKVGPRSVRFRCAAPRAAAVYLVGSFNGWNANSTPMRPAGRDGVWEAEVSLSPGLWRYAFVVDGRWLKPPDASLYESDGFGGENGVVEVPESR